MPPNDDVERPRASSAAERQKSIVSMTEFEGMDEYTALQKYILFYRDTRTNPHAEKTTKKKAWWQFWKSGSPTAAVPVEDSGAVPDECMYLPLRFSSLISVNCSLRAAMPRAKSAARHRSLCCCPRQHSVAGRGGVRAQAVCLLAWSCQPNASWRCSRGGANQGQRPTERQPAVQHAPRFEMSRVADFNSSDQHPAPYRSYCPRGGNPSQALWLQRDLV
tara:strand:+ start:11594 stop:12250 length:657 start_codon:yes stop_codon:yes gene_type:complete